MLRLKPGKRLRFRGLPLREDTGDLGNPCRGMYGICRMHADSLTLDQNGIPVTEFLAPAGHTMVLLEVSLQHFRETPLTDSALTNIRIAFQHFVKLRLSLILRFVYDWEGQGALHEPNHISQIFLHMEQLSPLLKEFGAHIFILQGLFIGSWGEMHNTRYASQSSLIALAEKLADCSCPSTYIAVRCPSQWRTIFRCYHPLSSADMKRGGSLRARFCLFNDGILGSPTDLGTYGTLSMLESMSYTDKLSRYDEEQFQNQLARYVPNGGEIVHASPLNDFQPALRTFSSMRISYLNSNYDTAVLNKWRSGASSGGAFRKCNDLDYITAHLGYRFALRKCEVRITLECCQVHLTIANQGFAPCYHDLDVSLVLCNEEGSTLYVHPVDAQARSWLPEADGHIFCQLPLPEHIPARTILGLRLTDRLLGCEVRLCNTPPLPSLTNPIGEILK